MNDSALEGIFQSIYSAVTESQNTIEQHYLGEIVEDYFEADGTPKMIVTKLPGANGELKERLLQIFPPVTVVKS